MSNESEPATNPRRIWPWFVLVGVVIAGVLAFFWVSAEVRRVKSFERFDYRPPAKAPPIPTPTNQITTTNEPAGK